MELIVPSIVETELTGYRGSVEQTRGKTKYTVSFFNGSEGVIVNCFRSSGSSHLQVPLNHNSTVARLVASGSRYFL
jgi:hypothetical protein